MNRHRLNTRKRRYRGGNGEQVAPTSGVPAENSTFKRTVKRIWGAVTDLFGKKEESVENTPAPAPAISAPTPLSTPSATLPQAGGRRRKHKASKKQRKHCKATKKHRKH